MAAKPKLIPSTASSGGTAVPLEHLDVVTVEEVSDDVWKLVLAEVGYPAGMSSDAFSKDALVDHLGTNAVAPDLIEALRAITELGTADAVDAMQAVADSHQVDPSVEDIARARR